MSNLIAIVRNPDRQQFCSDLFIRTEVPGRYDLVKKKMFPGNRFPGFIYPKPAAARHKRIFKVTVTGEPGSPLTFSNISFSDLVCQRNTND